MSNQQQPKQKKKRTPVIQNQFFLHHVREMRDQAVAKNWQSKHTYAKMVRALERYPLRLEAPRACLILEGFGAKTCEILQSKLDEYAKELGVPEEEALRIGNKKFATPKSIKLKVRKQPPAKRARLSEASDLDASASASALAVTAPTSSGVEQLNSSSLARSQLDLSQSSQSADASTSTQQPHRTFNPKPRTGAHAILLTLLLEASPDACLTKEDLISLAQRHCDSSFTDSPAGSHYTAWSAMGGLVKRGLIDRTPAAGRNPGSYTLTPAGRLAAASLMSGGGATQTLATTSKAKVPPTSLAAASKAKKPPTSLAATSKAKKPPTSLAATSKAKKPPISLAATSKAMEPPTSLAAASKANEPPTSLAATSKAMEPPTSLAATSKAMEPSTSLAATSKAKNPVELARQSVHRISDSEESEKEDSVLISEQFEPPAAAVNANHSVHSISDSESSQAEPDNAPPKVSLQFDYCSESGYVIVDKKSAAWRKFDPLLDCDCVLVVCEYEQLVRSNLHYSLDLEAIG